MTDKEFRRLGKGQLIDIIYHLEKDLEDQKKQNEELKRQLEDKNIRIANAGSIAEAAIELNKLFETAQATADQYLASIKAKATDPEEQEGE